MGAPSLRTYVDGRLFDSNRGSRRMDRRVDLTRERKRSVYGDSRLRFQSRDESSARFSCRCSHALCSGMCFSQNVLWQYSHSILRGDSVPHSAHLITARSEEHTSELQSLTNLVCRLLLEKKKKH